MINTALFTFAGSHFENLLKSSLPDYELTRVACSSEPLQAALTLLAPERPRGRRTVGLYDLATQTDLPDMVHVIVPPEWFESILMCNGWGDVRVVGIDLSHRVRGALSTLAVFAGGGNIPSDKEELPIDHAEYQAIVDREKRFKDEAAKYALAGRSINGGIANTGGLLGSVRQGLGQSDLAAQASWLGAQLRNIPNAADEERHIREYNRRKIELEAAMAAQSQQSYMGSVDAGDKPLSAKAASWIKNPFK